ncbi:MAG: hypothetical protein IT450_08260 [Phycisphaerales bacterium]|nr:hypothetical protein [Phycisphaerales bacterium]
MNHKKLAILLSAAVVAASSWGDTIRVDAKQTQNAPDGDSWCTAYPTLQQALARTGANEIWVARILLEDGTPGAYVPTALYPNDNDSRHATFHIPAGVKIYGGFRGADASVCDPNPSGYAGESDLRERDPETNLTILSGDLAGDDDGDGDGIPDQFPGGPTYGDNSYHVVYFDDFSGENSTKLSGFVIRGGYADLAEPRVVDENGGGVFIDLINGGPLLNRLVFEYNYALGDGYGQTGFPPSQQGGGGAFVQGDGDAYFTNCTFRDNVVEFGYGGGLMVSKLASGPSGHAGVHLQNCLFVSNTVIRGAGGGASAEGQDFVNLTFYGNQIITPIDFLPPAGAFYWNHYAARPLATIKNSIAWGDSPQELGGTAAQYCDVGDSTEWADQQYSFQNIHEDPRYHDVSSRDFRLIPPSHAKDVGNDPFVLLDTTDVDDDGDPNIQTPWDRNKLPRFMGIVDMGAYEHCHGDVDLDGDVDIVDLATLLGCFGTTDCWNADPDCCLSDLDGDDEVGIDDLSALLSFFGSTCPPAENLALTGGENSMTAEDPMTAWIRNATVDEILRWWEAGMPPIGDGTR